MHLAILAAAQRGHAPLRGARVRKLRPMHPSPRVVLWYTSKLVQLVHVLRKETHEAFKGLEHQWHPHMPAADAVTVGDAGLPDGIQAKIESLRHGFPGFELIARKWAGIAAEQSRDAVDERLADAVKRAIGIDVQGLIKAQGPLLQAMHLAIGSNVDLIKTIPAQYFDRVENTVSTGWLQGARWETLVKQIAEDGEITERRARLIARDQTSKMNAAFNQERQQQVGIEEYIWRTSQDVRVRGNPAGLYPDAESDHWELEGTQHRWDEPGPAEGSVAGEPCHPGEDALCRCTAEPVIVLEGAA